MRHAMLAVVGIVSASGFAAAPAAACEPAVFLNARPMTARERLETLVLRADAVVRARVMPADPLSRVAGNSEAGSVRFAVLDVVAGDSARVGTVLSFRGTLTDADDFNRRPVPYAFPRSKPLNGDCFATSYRAGAEYLLLLRWDGRGALTPYWAPLQPVNEQLHDVDDPWLAWVVDVLASGGRTRR